MHEENKWMPCYSLIRILKAIERYIEKSRDDLVIHSISVETEDTIVVEFLEHDNTLISQRFWLDGKELHIENAITRENVFDYAKEIGWSKEEVQYIKFGYI